MEKATASGSRPNRVPVSVITGFLGSGKTTVINHLVRQPGMERTVLIVNEFGEIGLDHLLIESATAIENTLLLENGCICCSIRGDLVDTITDLFAKAAHGDLPSFDRILVETTGMADPAPIVRAIADDPGVNHRCRLDGVMTTVDGLLGRNQMAEHEEAVLQVALADKVLITKKDLCDESHLIRLRVEIAAVNPTLRVLELDRGRIDPETLFDAAADDPVIAVEKAADGDDAPSAGSRHDHGHVHGAGHDHDHTGHAHRHGVVTTWSLVGGEPLDWDRLRDWLQMLYSLYPSSLLRLKGIVEIAGDQRPLLLHAVGSLFYPPEWMADWPGGQRTSQLVIIFKGWSASAVERSFLRHVRGRDVDLADG